MSTGFSGNKGFTHLDEHGHARMVNVTAKAETNRLARTHGTVHAPQLASLDDGALRELLNAAQVAGLQAAKQTPHLIPLCHSLSASASHLSFTVTESSIAIEAIATTHGRTGVEMEALTSCMVAALTILAGLFSHNIDGLIDGVTLCEKIGGKSSHWRNPSID